HVRRDGFVRQFEANLIVTFASATVGQAICAQFERDFCLALGDYRTRHGSPEQIRVLVDGAGAKRGPDKVADKFFAEVFDGCGGRAGGERFLVCSLEIFLLADVADHGDDFTAVIFLKPRNDDAGVESAGIGEYDFFRFWSSSIHNASFGFEIASSLRQKY